MNAKQQVQHEKIGQETNIAWGKAFKTIIEAKLNAIFRLSNDL